MQVLSKLRNTIHIFALLNQKTANFINTSATATTSFSHQRNAMCLSHKLFASFSSDYKFGSQEEKPKYKQNKSRVPVQYFLTAHNIEFIDGPSTFKVKYCPFCTKPHNEDPSNLNVLHIHKEMGYYHCFRCSSKGNWLQFREKILGINVEEPADYLRDESRNDNRSAKIEQNKMSDAQFYFHKINLWHEDYKDVLEYLHSRGFKNQTIKNYNIGAGVQDFYDSEGINRKIKCVYFPNYKIMKQDQQKQTIRNQFSHPNQGQNNFFSNNNWTEIVKVKIRGASKENKKYMRQHPAGSQKGFFGLNMVKDDDKDIVITEGEFDAMAVYQQTGIPSLSLPQGATNLPDHLLPYLQRFQRIYLWMDNDEAGQLNKGKIADKIGLNRTFLISHSIPKMKDANDFLKTNPLMIKELISKAKTIPESNLVTFSNFRDIIYSRINKQEENQGCKISWLPFFNKKVKGIRMGELTVVSGPTGSGKTTFLAQVSLDLCKKDIAVLWGSFQIRTEILLAQMINQFSGVNLYKNPEKFEFYADAFGKLPLHFMNFYGSSDIEKVLSTIVYSIQKYNVNLIIIDTLQFLLSGQGEGFKKFQIQDHLMSQLRQISIKHNVHICIVIHPRKTQDGEDIGIHSIYGTSKATQEADNIWVIQNREGFKLFDVKKNRYDGQLGRIPLGFNRNIKSFLQLTKQQFQNLRSKDKTMLDIVNDRQTKQKSQAQYDYSQEIQSILQEQIQDFQFNRKAKQTNFFTKKE